MIKKFLSRFQESPLFLNSRTLIIGTVIAQLIPIAIQPFLRRYFSAEDFGIAAIFSALVGMGVSAANLKYENAIVLPEKEEEATHLLIGGVGISAIFSLLCDNEGIMNIPQIDQYCVEHGFGIDRQIINRHGIRN